MKAALIETVFPSYLAPLTQNEIDLLPDDLEREFARILLLILVSQKIKQLQGAQLFYEPVEFFLPFFRAKKRRAKPDFLLEFAKDDPDSLQKSTHYVFIELYLKQQETMNIRKKRQVKVLSEVSGCNPDYHCFSLVVDGGLEQINVGFVLNYVRMIIQEVCV